MKILIIVNEFPPDIIAGTAMSTFYLSKHLHRHGLDVHVAVTMKKKGTAPEEIINGVRVHRFEPASMKLTRAFQRFLWLRRLALIINPDIIQGQAISCGMHAALIGKQLRKPSITYIQGYDLYHASATQKRTEIKIALKYSDAILAVSQDLKEKAQDVLLCSDILVMPHGLQVENGTEAKPELLNLEPLLSLPKNTILFAGRLNTQKGLIYLIDAMKIVSDRHQNVRLILIGDGDQKEALLKRVEKLGLSNTVCFVGPKSHAAVLAFMEMADIFVLPSIEEAFGIVLLEAMYYRLPVVSTNVQGIPYIIKDGRNGFLVPPRNHEQLANRMMFLLENRNIREEMGETNHKDSLQYKWERLVEKYISLYRNLLHKRGISAN
jgi:glycosyltransferase involved in cell wall biosynthesis